MALIGYARCSTLEQNVEDQERRLKEAGCTRVFKDRGVSGKLASRPDFDACMAYLREGDVLVITKLDRAGRSLQHLITLSTELRERGIGLKVLDQPIDTTTPVGRLFFSLVAAFAEFERDLIIERTHEGLKTAKLNGKKPGPKPKLDAERRRYIRLLHEAGVSVTAIARTEKVSRPLIYRVLEEGKK